MCAYEALWDTPESTVKRVTEKFSGNEYTPSKLISDDKISEYERRILEFFNRKNFQNFSVILKNFAEYPSRLLDAKYPPEILYYQGNWDLINSKSVAVIGSRKASTEGLKRTRKIVKHLVEDGYTIISGLASGIDTMAHQSALEFGGKTIAVIGTPLTHCYPKDNKDLQSLISKEFLLISQVPFIKYTNQDFRANRYFFPERNAVMSAISLGSIIIEAGETSGTLTQARAAIQQGRKLFILENNFNNKNLSWPSNYLSKGAVRVKEYSDVSNALKSES